MRTLVVLGALALAITLDGCGGKGGHPGYLMDATTNDMSAPHISGVSEVAAHPLPSGAQKASDERPFGAQGEMPAFYDDESFTINSKELGSSEVLLAHNENHNIIYATNDLDDEQDFFPVLDAIQGDGFNPLWLQVLIHFNPGFTPRQLTSDVEVLAAAAGDHPEITLEQTDEVYRCSVVGSK